MLVISGQPTDRDVVIVGAGAAGVAAGYLLSKAGLSVQILEARDRIGGRAHTVSEDLPAPLDLGCEWLHSADVNPVVAVAQSLGLTIDRTKPNWGSHVGAAFSDAEHAAFQKASDRFWDALERASHDGGPDRQASDLLEPGNKWNPLLGAISTYYNGVELDGVSVVDLDRYVDTGVNWRIAEGYGTFVVRAASSLDVKLNCRVKSIDHSGTVIRIDTDGGSLTTRAVIVTLPTNVLAGDGLRFIPDLPRKRDAAKTLPLGLADKIFFSVAPDADIPSGHLFGSKDRVETISFDLRPRGRPVIHGFVGGAFARHLEQEGARVFEAEARAQLTRMLGAEVQSKLTYLLSTAWANDPFAQGAYSHAKPGYADMRVVLGECVDDRIFFAGEACSPKFFSTAHGAWQTGIDAAKALLGSMA